MDSKERHELKDNDLAEFLENFGDFWGKHGNGILVVAIAVMAVWFGMKYYRSSVSVGHDNAWADLAATSTPQGYRERAVENASYAGVPHLALLRGAEAYHKQAIKLKQDEGGDEDTGVMSAEESLDAADKMFNQVLSSDAPDPYRANAAVGLANLAETRGDFDAAAKHWAKAKQIADDARLTTISTLVDLRIDMLDGLKRPIVFGESGESFESTEDVPTEANTSAAPAEDTTDTPVEAVEVAEPAGAAPASSPGQ